LASKKASTASTPGVRVRARVRVRVGVELRLGLGLGLGLRRRRRLRLRVGEHAVGRGVGGSNAQPRVAECKGGGECELGRGALDRAWLGLGLGLGLGAELLIVPG